MEENFAVPKDLNTLCPRRSGNRATLFFSKNYMTPWL